MRSAGGGGSRAKLRVARAARSYSLALARTRTPAGRGCCHGYGARALTLTNGWPRVSRTQRCFYICRDTHLSVRGREGKREDGDGSSGGGRGSEVRGRDRRPPTTVGSRPFATTSPPAFGLLCYPDGIMPHSSCLLGNKSRVACLYIADECDFSHCHRD